MLARDRGRYVKRQIVRFAKSPRLASSYAAYRQAIRAADWPAVRESVHVLTKLAIQAGDRRVIDDMVKALRRLDCYQEAGRLWITELAPRLKVLPNEWRGEDLSGKSVLVNLNHTRRQGLGTGYRCANLLPKISASARRTTVIVEPRLVKTFQRSLPKLEILSSLEQTQHERFDYVALPEFLTAWFADDRANPEFRALEPNRDKAATLRSKYLEKQGADADKPLIGICWYSSHFGKDLPELRCWRDFIARIDAAFVSLQYGDVSRDVTALGRDRIIVDNSIDQLSDMDDFAAQVAALDGVITVVNTLVEVASALDVPTVVLRDDWFRRDLPVLSDQVPYYPNLRVAGKNGRDWGPVLDEAWLKLSGLLSKRPLDK